MLKVILDMYDRIFFPDKMAIPIKVMAFMVEYCQLRHYKTENISFLSPLYFVLNTLLSFT